MIEQLEMQLPGLATEVQKYMKVLELPDITNHNGTKMKTTAWKRLVKDAIRKHCEKYFLQTLPDSKKLKENCKNETFNRKNYINDMTMKEAQTYFNLEHI